MACSGFYQQIDVWEWETVLWTSFNEVSEVDADSSLSVYLFDHHWVGQPVGVVHLAD